MKIIYTPFPTKDEAIKIANLLVEKKFVACANIISNITSIFSFKGEIQSCEEVILIAKTNDTKIKAAMDFIKLNHSYEVAAILAINIDEVNTEFFEWLNSTVAGNID